MSKFFRGGATSDTESESESSDSDIQPVRTAPSKPLFSASESEEEEKRVVRAAKDKRFDELKDLIKQLKNSKKIKDMSKVLTVFEDLAKAYSKAKPLIDKEGGFAPRFYLRCIVELEDFINEQWEDREGRKNLSKNNARGLTTMRQKLKKYIRDFETEINEYRENPDPEGYSTEEDEPESESEEEPEVVVPKKPAAGKESTETKRARRPMEFDEDDESDWEESDEDDSEFEGFEGKKLEELRLFFLKSAAKEEKPKKKDERQKRRDDREKPAHRTADDEDEDGEWQQAHSQGAVPAERPKMFEKESEITPEAIIKKLNELLATRGKKSTDRKILVETFKELLGITEAKNFSPALSMKVLDGVIAATFDYNPKISDCMVYTAWLSALNYTKQLLSMLIAQPTIYCSEYVPDDGENILDTTTPIKLRVSILAVSEHLDDEFTKILQDADCHSTDYVDKLKSEKDVCELINDIQAYLENGSGQEAHTDELCRIYMRKIDHLYYKFDKLAVAEEADSATPTDTSRIMSTLCQFIYAKDSTKRLRTRAMLCRIYYCALHGRWHEARDLMLMSHLQQTIDHSDIATQILYNRTSCQLGLCAFRHGYIKDAHSALSDIQNSGKAKELLAQGMILRNQDRTPEQEKIERQRQIPYHMHINLELLECVYLLCAMLLEIPQVASREFEVRRRMISRSFHYQLRQSERQSLIGPPENTREHVVAASRALLNGDWQACRDFVVNDKMNAKVWNLFHHSEKVKSMIVRRIQEECLRTYLFTYSSIYDSISLKNLSQMFQLEQKAVHSIISKMIILEELLASFDEPAECVVMHRVEPSRLQTLALQLTEKLNHLAENVETIMDPRSGQGMGYRQNWGQRQQNQQDHHQKQQDDQAGGQNRPRRQDYGGGRGGGGGGSRDYGGRGGGSRDYGGRGGGNRDYGGGRGGGNRDYGGGRGGGGGGNRDYGGKRQYQKNY